MPSLTFQLRERWSAAPALVAVGGSVGVLAGMYLLPVVSLALVLFGLVVLAAVAGARTVLLEVSPSLLVAGAAALALVVVGTTFFDLSATPGANVAKLLLAVALGTLLARNIDELVWALPISGIIVVFDLWSVFSSSGLTHQLMQGAEPPPSGAGLPAGAVPVDGVPEGAVLVPREAQGAGSVSPAGLVLSTLLIQGPRLWGRPIFEIGMSDVVFMSAYMLMTWIWSLGPRRNAIALAASMLATAILAAALERALPALPLMAIAFVCVNIRRLVPADISIPTIGRSRPSPEQAAASPMPRPENPSPGTIPAAGHAQDQINVAHHALPAVGGAHAWLDLGAAPAALNGLHWHEGRGWTPTSLPAEGFLLVAPAAQDGWCPAVDTAGNHFAIRHTDLHGLPFIAA